MTQQPGSWTGQQGPPVTAPPATTGAWAPQQGPPVMAPPPATEAWTPERVDAVAGTEFGLVQLRVASITSGLAIGSLIAGIAAILVSTLVLCFGVAGAGEGWGVLVGGAFALLGVVVGGGSVGLGLAARRQIARSGQAGRLRFTGRGLALAGISCGGSGAGIAVLALLLSVVLQSS